MLPKLLFHKLLSGRQPLQAPCNRHRVIRRAEWIDLHIHLQVLFELPAHVVREAGAEEEEGVGRVDASLSGARGDGHNGTKGDVKGGGS